MRDGQSTPLTDEFLAQELKRVLTPFLDKPESPCSLPEAVFAAVSSLNGNAKGGRSTYEWLLRLMSDEESGNADEDKDINYSVNQFFDDCLHIGGNVGGSIKEIIRSTNGNIAFAAQVSNTSPSWIENNQADARFMPGSSARRLPRLVASFEILKVFHRHDLLTSFDIVGAWKGLYEPDDDVTDDLRKISGFTIAVGLNQLRRICGDSSAIKIDRRLERAFPRLLGTPHGGSELATKLTKLAPLIRDSNGEQLTPAALDHAIWQWMATK